MNVTLTAWEIALLFGALEQPMPPSVEVIVREASKVAVVTRLTAARESLIERGDFVQQEGRVSLAEPLASLLTACVASDMILVCEAADHVTGVLYLSDTYTVSVSESDGLFALDLARTRGDSSAMLLEMLGKPSTTHDGLPFSMPIAADRGAAAGDSDLAMAFEQMSEDAQLVKTTAIRQGHEGVLVTRIRRSPHGAWGIGAVAAPGMDLITLGWYSEDELLGAVMALPELETAPSRHSTEG